MEQSLDILDRALQGDPSALSFLERTASIYVLNYNAEGQHTTYGCWDFLNDALNEIERFENNAARAGYTVALHIEPHVQLLCKMCQKAARRGRESDRRLITTCLTNAGIEINRITAAQTLVDHNCHMRERVMGRFATSAFDFSYANINSSHSVFSRPATMEKLCSVLAANVIASGPAALKTFALEWLIPSATSMPPFSVIAIALHLGDEGLSNTVPVGTGEMLTHLSPPLVAKVIGPTLCEALRESDQSDTHISIIRGPADAVSTTNYNHRLSALSLRALERWCTAVDLRVVDLWNICKDSEVKIIDVITDALYSNVELVVDAAADLTDVILCEKSSQNYRNYEVLMRDNILSELASAIGLQRFRFVGRQSMGDVSVCRCLTRIAAAVAVASQHLIRASIQAGQSLGILDLLLHACSHNSVHISGIAVEVIPLLVVDGSNLFNLLLPVLLRRSIWPESITSDPNVLSPQQTPVDCDVSFDEFENFRESILATALDASYTFNPQHYMKTCVNIVTEICSTHSRANWRQLESAIFCINAVSIEACKFAVSESLQAGSVDKNELNNDGNGELHDTLLGRCVYSLAESPDVATCNPLVLAQMCRFIGKYGNWFAKSSQPGILDLGAKLSLGTFETATSAFRGDALAQNIIHDMSISPFAEAAIAIRCILSRSPDYFTTPQALAALAEGWDVSYSMADQHSSITIEDRESLCSGICRVLATLTAEKWGGTLSNLARPTIEKLSAVIGGINEMMRVSMPNKDSVIRSHFIHVGEEIRLLFTMIRTFNSTAGGQIIDEYKSSSRDESTSFEHPSLIVIHKAMDCLKHCALYFNDESAVVDSLGNLLTQAIVTAGQMINPLPFIKQISELGVNIISGVARSNGSASLLPTFMFIEELIELYGSAIAGSNDNFHFSSTPITNELSTLIVTLLRVSSDAISLSAGNIWMQAKEQRGGQNSLEAPQEKSYENDKKSSEALAGIFSMMTKCITLCPTLLIQIQPFKEDSQPLFAQSMEVATKSFGNKDRYTTRSAILYIKSVIELQHPRSSPQFSDPTLSTLQSHITNSFKRILPNIIQQLIYGICGHFEREILDPSALLLFSIIERSPSLPNVDLSLSQAFQREHFLLGDEAISLSLNVCNKCAMGKLNQNQMIEFVHEIWQMHESDDAGSIAGGDAVRKLHQKFCN